MVQKTKEGFYLSNLEWLSRIEQAIRISLPEVSAKFDDYEIRLTVNTTKKHPSLSFYTEMDTIIYEFCTIHFDPVNQELYSYYLNEDFELNSKILFTELEEIIDFIYDAFFDFLDHVDEDDENVQAESSEENEQLESELPYSEIDVIEENIQWISNDKHLEIEQNWNGGDHFTILLKLGVNTENGDGLLYRSVIFEEDGNEVQETNFFSFKEEEAEYVIDLLNDYIRYLEKK